MKIALALPFAKETPNGVAISVKRIAKNLLKAGHEVGIFDPPKGESWQGFDLVHVFYPRETLTVKTSVPIVVSLRGAEFEKGINLDLVKKAQAVTAVSPELAVKYQEITGKSAQIVLNSVDLSDFEGTSTPPDYPYPILACAGVFRDRFDLLEVLQYMQTEPGFLLLVGDFISIAAKNAFLVQVARLGLNARYAITGFMPHERVLSYLARCAAFVYPVTGDGCSNAVLEAMAAGVPTVATRAGSLPAILSPYDYLYDSGGLKEALSKALAAPRQEEPRKQWVTNNFYPAKEVGEYLSIYEQL